MLLRRLERKVVGICYYKSSNPLYMSVLPPWSQWTTDKNFYEKPLHLIYTWTAIYDNYWQRLHCIMGYKQSRDCGLCASTVHFMEGT